MATKGTSEREEDLNDLFSDEEELEDNDWDSDEDESSEDAEAAAKAERDKLREEIRKEVEDSVVAELAKGDTQSGIFKGLQRVLAKRDAELTETRNALAGLIDKVNNADNGSQAEFLTTVIRDLLDEDSKKAFEDKLDRFNSAKKQKEQERILNTLLTREQQPRYVAPSQFEDDPKIAEYRKEASKQLKNFAKKSGFDPETKGLEFGDEDEPLLVRMNKLATSIEQLSAEQDDKEVASVRRKGSQPTTRTGREPVQKTDYGRSLIERGTQDMISKMRNIK